MRTELVALLIAVAAGGARAEPSLLTISSEHVLRVGEASTLTIEVDLPSDAAKPLLVTVRAEGAALEVVRGRVSREDARASQTSKLAFAIPVVSHAPGSSVVRAHLRYFRCAETCSAEEAVTTSVVEVRAR